MKTEVWNVSTGETREYPSQHRYRPRSNERILLAVMHGDVLDIHVTSNTDDNSYDYNHIATDRSE